jgi:hypothetical protein
MGAPEGYNRSEILYRIGTFFLLIGLGLMVFFFMSEAESQPTFNYFCWGMILLTLGFMFRAQYRKTVPPSGRFSIFKRFRRGRDE